MIRNRPRRKIIPTLVSLALKRRNGGEHAVAVERAVQVFGFDADAPANALPDVIRDEIDHFASALADQAVITLESRRGGNSARSGAAAPCSPNG